MIALFDLSILENFFFILSIIILAASLRILKEIKSNKIEQIKQNKTALSLIFYVNVHMFASKLHEKKKIKQKQKKLL